jgi:hypothetical protein
MTVLALLFAFRTTKRAFANERKFVSHSCFDSLFKAANQIEYHRFSKEIAYKDIGRGRESLESDNDLTVDD